MRTSLGQIFWGLLLVILNIRIYRFDVLPDFIGYILVAVGAGGLVAVSGRFITARYLSWMLMPVSLLSLVPDHELGLLPYLVQATLNIGMIWSLLGGIADLAVSCGRLDLAGHAAKRRTLYASFMGFSVLLILQARADRSEAGLAAVLIVIAMLVITVLVLQLIWKVRDAVAA
jgi:hypothetical protein